jgi:hypothetical protein
MIQAAAAAALVVFATRGLAAAAAIHRVDFTDDSGIRRRAGRGRAGSSRSSVSGTSNCLKRPWQLQQKRADAGHRLPRRWRARYNGGVGNRCPLSGSD